MPTPPRWDMSNVYPSLESKEFKEAVKDYKKQVARLEDFFDKKISKAGAKTRAKELAPLVGEAINRLNQIQTLSDTIGPFIYAYISTDSRNKAATRILSEFEQASLPTDKLIVRFRSWLGKVEGKLDKITAKNEAAKAHAFLLNEWAEQSKYQMSDEQEGLAAELSLSGGNAFGKLQGTVTSQLSVDFELDGKIQKLPMPALINLRSHPDENTRHRAYEAENKAWETVKETLAACLNGVKGEANTLNIRRGREDAVHSALELGPHRPQNPEGHAGRDRRRLPHVPQVFQCQGQETGEGKTGLVGYVCAARQDR